jgi:hypothetical protein
LLAAGLDVVSVNCRLGHATVVTTLRHYAHCVPDHGNRVVAALSGIIGEIGHS